MKIVIITTFMAAMAVSSSANAQSGCADVETQSGINQCRSGAVDRANGALQGVYDRLRSQLGPNAKRELRDAQRGWIAYRDNWCTFESRTVSRGSMYPSVVSACLVRLINEQTERLTYQLTCNEDVNCARLSDD